MNKDETLFQALRDNWQVAMVIVSIIFSWAYFQFSLKSLEVRVSTVELKASAIDSLQGDLKAINAKLDIILSGKYNYK